MRWYTCIKYKKYFIYVCILIYIYLHIYREWVDVNIYIYTQTWKWLWSVTNLQISINQDKTLRCSSRFQTWMVLTWLHQSMKAHHQKKTVCPWIFFGTALELSKPFRLLQAFGSSNGQRNTFAFSPGQGRYELYGSVYGSNLQLVSLSTSKISPDTWSAVICGYESSQQTSDATSPNVGKGSVWSEADRQHG